MEDAANRWQEPPEVVLHSLFEFFLTLEDGEPLLRVSSHVCSSWRRAALEVRLSDTGASKPAGWRHIPLPSAPQRRTDSKTDPSPPRRSPPSPAAAVYPAVDEDDTSIQAIIVKTEGEPSVSVGCGEALGGKKEGIEIGNVTTAIAANAQHHHRGTTRNKRDRNNSNPCNGDPADVSLQLLPGASSLEETRGGGVDDIHGDGSFGGGAARKRQKLLPKAIPSNKQRISNRGVNTREADVVEQDVEGNKQGNRMNRNGIVNGGVGHGARQHHVEGSEQQGLGWATRIWGAVQRFRDLLSVGNEQHQK